MSVKCAAKCGDPVMNKETIYKEKFVVTNGYDPKMYCHSCFKELAFGVIPMVTDSSLAPSGTGLVHRQKVGKRRTDG